MKWLALILLMVNTIITQAQRSMQTIVPLQPIAVGAAFQVQYIVTGDEPVATLQSPAFGQEFRFVSGPRLYQGEALLNNKKVPVQNFSYTLIPLRKGRLVVKGATAVFSSGTVKSNDTYIVVTEGAVQDSLTATSLSNLPRLAPGANWKKKLQEQLFIKTAVSKQRCFVGEPVVATFTLFSRLPSASEIIKNPGFYGFSVLDMPDVADGGQTVQTHNGTFYNTHLLRNVQLYPAQSGNLLIDKMSVNNAIEYADSASGALVQTTIVLESDPIAIAVMPLPATTASSFAGAVGHFSINAYLDKGEWRQNSTGKLLVRINGSGNFVQLTAPEIRWPKGVDVLEPTITERLQKEVVPVTGTRTYTYTLTADSTGHYTIPPIAFTYFDPGAKKFKTTATDSLHFNIAKGDQHAARTFRFSKHLPHSHTAAWLLAGLAAVAIGIFFWLRKYRPVQKPAPTTRIEPGPPDFAKRIQDISPTEALPHRTLQQELMGFLKSLPGQPDVLAAGAMQQAAALPGDVQQELQTILHECEAVQYYNAAPAIPFSELQQRAIQVVHSVQQRQPPKRS